MITQIEQLQIPTLYCDSRQPSCLQNPEWKTVLEFVGQLLEAFPCECFIYGGANYKSNPSDLDFVIFGLSKEQKLAFINYIQTFLETLECYEKTTGYQATIIKSSWNTKHLDWNICNQDETLLSHANQIDFTIGACYFDIRRQVTVYPHIISRDHLENKQIATFIPFDILAKKDPSVLFRMIRILAKEPSFSLTAPLQEAIQALYENPDENIFLDHKTIKPNRLHQEVSLCWNSGYAHDCLLLLERYELIDKIFPELTGLAPEQRSFVIKLMQEVSTIQDSAADKYSISMLYYALNWFILNPDLDLEADYFSEAIKSFYYNNYQKTTLIWHKNQTFFHQIREVIMIVRGIVTSYTPSKQEIEAIAKEEHAQKATPIWQKNKAHKKAYRERLKIRNAAAAADTASESDEETILALSLEPSPTGIDAVEITEGLSYRSPQKTKPSAQSKVLLFEKALAEQYQIIELSKLEALLYDVIISNDELDLKKIPLDFNLGHIIALVPKESKAAYRIYLFDRKSAVSLQLIQESFRPSELVSALPKMPQIAQVSTMDMKKILTRGGEETLNPKHLIVEALCTKMIDDLNAIYSKKSKYKKLPSNQKAMIKEYLAKAYCQRGAVRFILSLEDSASCKDDFDQSLHLAAWLPDVYLQRWEMSRGHMKSSLHYLNMTSRNYNAIFDCYNHHRNEAENNYLECKERNANHPEIAMGLEDMQQTHAAYELLSETKFAWRLECLELLKTAQQHEVQSEEIAIACYQQIFKINTLPQYQSTLDIFKATAQKQLLAYLTQVIGRLSRQNDPNNITSINNYFIQLLDCMHKCLGNDPTDTNSHRMLPKLYFKWGQICDTHHDPKNALEKYELAATGYQKNRDFNKVAECYKLISRLPILSESQKLSYDKKIGIVTQMAKQGAGFFQADKNRPIDSLGASPPKQGPN